MLNWTCTVCTLVNKSCNKTCAACNTRYLEKQCKESELNVLDPSLEKENAPLLKKQNDEWSCAICTLLNKRCHQICAACGTLKSSKKPNIITINNHNDKKILMQQNESHKRGRLEEKFQKSESDASVPSVKKKKHCKNDSINNDFNRSDKTSQSNQTKIENKQDKEKKKNEFTFLTYNICFDTYEMELRMYFLGREILRLRPDFISFQEVTPDMLRELKNQSWYSNYWASRVPKNVPYFAMLFCRYKPLHMGRIPFTNSVMGRDLIAANVELPLASENANKSSIRLTVATSHLESTWQFAKPRKVQLSGALIQLSRMKECDLIYMGDMNLRGKECADVIEKYGWDDGWLKISGNSNKNGYTMDGKKNTYIETKGKRPYRARLDRVFLRLKKLQLSSIKMIGTKPVSVATGPKERDLFISDHFGLFTILSLAESG